MADNITIVSMVNLEEFVKNCEKQLNDIIKNSTYSELTKYINMLPEEYANEDSLFYWGFSYLNEYYKIIGKLDGINTPEIEDLKYKIYILYLKENYNKTVFTFDEFITFSKIINVAFSDYNPNKTRKSDKELYQSGDEKIDYEVNSIANDVLHSPHPHAYEITKFKLKTLLNVLNTKSSTLLSEEFNKIDLDDDFLSQSLSESRIKELKKAKKKLNCD